MAEELKQPQPPEGFQRPGVPGAGNLLDPAVRGELREQLHEAAHGARVQGAAGQEQAAPVAKQPAPRYRAGPYPHGDVDLSELPANVPLGPVRPNRQRGGRRFYFLKEAAAGQGEAPSANPPRPAGPHPG